MTSFRTWLPTALDAASLSNRARVVLSTAYRAVSLHKPRWLSKPGSFPPNLDRGLGFFPAAPAPSHSTTRQKQVTPHGAQDPGGHQSIDLGLNLCCPPPAPKMALLPSPRHRQPAIGALCFVQRSWHMLLNFPFIDHKSVPSRPSLEVVGLSTAPRWGGVCMPTPRDPRSNRHLPGLGWGLTHPVRGMVPRNRGSSCWTRNEGSACWTRNGGSSCWTRNGGSFVGGEPACCCA